MGIDNPAFQNAPQPLTTHPGDLLQHHSVDRFGCTICHQGQGRATDKDAAHGRVPFWDQPLLVGDLVQATCTKCHHEDDVPQAPVLARGQHLLSDLGCAGCHQLGQETVTAKAGPPLSRTGSKVTPQVARQLARESQKLSSKSEDAAVRPQSARQFNRCQRI